jgi:hypothetical protein
MQGWSLSARYRSRPTTRNRETDPPVQTQPARRASSRHSRPAPVSVRRRVSASARSPGPARAVHPRLGCAAITSNRNRRPAVTGARARRPQSAGSVEEQRSLFMGSTHRRQGWFGGFRKDRPQLPHAGKQIPDDPVLEVLELQLAAVVQHRVPHIGAAIRNRERPKRRRGRRTCRRRHWPGSHRCVDT